MYERLYSFFSLLLDVISLPRPTERTTAALTTDTLRSLASRPERSGLLPYCDPRVRALVWEVKYHRNTRAVALVSPLLAEAIIAEAVESLGTPLLIPIPMHYTRRRVRGYSQCEFLCEASLPHLQQYVTYAPDALVRTRHTAPQQRLSREARLHNLSGSMEVPHSTKVAGRTCIVIDDVATTGSTFAEAKRALAHAGAERVVCIALAYA